MSPVCHAVLHGGLTKSADECDVAACAQLATDQVAKALKVQRGAVIQGIAPNSAAAKAGLLTTRRGLTGIVPGGASVPFCAVCLRMCCSGKPLEVTICSQELVSEGAGTT